MSKPANKQIHNDNLRLNQSERSEIVEVESIVEPQRSRKRPILFILIALVFLVAIFLLGWFLVAPLYSAHQITNLNQKKENTKEDFLPKQENSESKKPGTPSHEQEQPHENPNGPHNPPTKNPKEENPSINSTNSTETNTTEAESALCRARNWPVFAQGPVRRKVYDLFIMRDELDLLELRLGEMWDEVDYFIIVEAPQAFTGAPKNLTLLDNWDMFKRFHSKIIRHTLNFNGTNLRNTWEREEFQRNSMYDQVVPYLTGDQKINQGDVILVSDLDELIRPVVVKTLRTCDYPKVLILASLNFYYAYGFEPNPQLWPHPEATWYDGNNTIKPQKLRQERGNPRAARYDNAGWHCSWCFPKLSDIVGKLNTFSHQEYNKEEYTNRSKILYRIVNGLNLFGLNPNSFTTTHENPDVPKYVKDNREKFIYLLHRPKPHGNFIDFTPADASLL